MTFVLKNPTVIKSCFLGTIFTVHWSFQKLETQFQSPFLEKKTNKAEVSLIFDTLPNFSNSCRSTCFGFRDFGIDSEPGPIFQVTATNLSPPSCHPCPVCGKPCTPWQAMAGGRGTEPIQPGPLEPVQILAVVLRTYGSCQADGLKL